MDDWIKDTLKGLLLGLLACAVMALLWGCRTKYVPVPSVSVDSVYVDRFHRDSVYLHDSVFVNQYSKGDTVFVDKVVTRYRYKDRWRQDTVAVVRTDSVRVPYPIGKELGWWSKFCISAFPYFAILALMLCLIIVWILKCKLKNK